MANFNRIYVALALNELDAVVLRAASLVTSHLSPRKVFFGHVAESLDLPAEIKNQLPPMPTDELLEARADEEIKQHFTAQTNADLRVEILEGHALNALLHGIKRHEIDLFIMGALSRAHGGGVLSQRIVHKAPCSVLVIPEESKLKLDHILVATDFSDSSGHALSIALELAKNAGTRELSIVHCYDVPQGAYKSGIGLDKFAQIMLGHAQKDYEKFIAQFDTAAVSIKPVFIQARKPADAITEHAAANNIDLVIMGARGRSTSAAILLGSVTERTLGNATVPVLTVRKPGHRMSILDALLNL